MNGNESHSHTHAVTMYLIVRLKVYSTSFSAMDFSFNNKKLKNNMRERSERAKNQWGILC